MEVWGIDFTSRPSTRKAITRVRCELDGGILRTRGLDRWADFQRFEGALRTTGNWIAGIDFPFGQSRRFLQNIGWPLAWEAYVAHAESLGREGFRDALESYRVGRPLGDKEHRRLTDVAAGSISPQKLYGVPVGLMFFEGAPRLLAAGVHIPHLRSGDADRIVVEAYPGVLARAIIGRRSYKHDARRKQTSDQKSARIEILDRLRTGWALERYGFSVDAPDIFCDDPSGDDLDALLSAMQAAWAYSRRKTGFGAPSAIDAAEGWIADPHLS